MQRATGTFEVTMTPQSTDTEGDGAPLGRLSLAKTFSGDIAGTSRGEMLSAGNPAQGSAAYVAVERVRGTVHGREGSFALYHVGTMDRGAYSHTIRVVPDSGTGALAGLTGTFTIDRPGAGHAYTFDYSLPDAT